MFYFLKKFIKNSNDFLGILFSFFLSTIIPAFIFFFELFVRPIKLIQTRGFQRLEGAFADVLNYSIYCSCAILIAFYFYLRSKKGVRRQKNLITLIIVLSIVLLALVRINHMATYGVVAAIFAFFLIASIGKGRSLALIFFLMTTIFVFYQLRNDFEERFSKSYESELSVIKGERGTEQAFHGRAHRWLEFSDYLAKSPFYYYVIGVSSASDPESQKFFGGWMHNDYLRLFAYTGFIGLICYLGFMFYVFLKSRKFPTPEKFLIRSTVAMILLYSMSTLPSLYFPLLLVVVPIYVLALSPLIFR